MTAKRKHRKNRRISLSVWVVNILLIILLLSSALLLSMLLRSWSDGDNNVIALWPSSGLNDNVVEPAYAEEMTEVPADKEPGIITYDEDAQWKTTTSINLFQDAYTNDSGEVTVKSADGDKVIAPGTSEDYSFSLKNTGNVSLDYTMELQSIFEWSEIELPIQVRLRKGKEWVVGSDQQWQSISDLKKITEKGTLEVNRYVTYTLEWQWPYEEDSEDMQLLQDINDTIAGDTAVSQQVNFELDINTQAKVTPGAVAVDINGNPLYKLIETYKSQDSPTKILIGMPLAASLGSLLGLLLLFLLWWRNKIYIAGFLLEQSGEPAYEYMLNLKSKTKTENDDVVRIDGRFEFPKVPVGISTLTLENPYRNEIARNTVSLKRKRKMESMQITVREDYIEIELGYRIIAIEVYLDCHSGQDFMDIQSFKWAAIDKDHHVYTPEGIMKSKDGYNKTPGGLKIDDEGKLSI